MDTTMPTDNSDGANTVLPIKSAKISKNAPINALITITDR